MNCRRRGISYPTHPPPVCCLSEHSGMLDFALLHTRMPVVENEVKSTTQEPIQSSGTLSSFSAVHEAAVLQSESLVLTQSFRLLLVILPHGNGPRQGKIPNQVRQQGREFISKGRGAGECLPGCLRPSSSLQPKKVFFSSVHKE